ncbi:MAG: ABC transporter ATP-binding protein [Leptolinea sp.]|jgi:putative ABC transport system ATP-binding protein|nr:ABC transporter ATP-binding protein [Leptolinea sp.]
MERKTIIQTIDLVKNYGEGENMVRAVDKISITIDEGEFVAIMGPSGSGKSTLMNILACLDRPSEGQYILAGEDVSNYSRTELARIRGKELGFVFQSFNLLPRMTALENVMLPLMYRPDRPTTIPERKELALKVLENVGLGGRANHLPSELSGGQQQRVAIARVLINDPILVLADEPTGNLDTKSSEEIMGMLHDLNERGRTIVMVTHEPEIAAHTQRILHIRDGKLHADEKNGHHYTKRVLQAVDMEPQKI